MTEETPQTPGEVAQQRDRFLLNSSDSIKGVGKIDELAYRIAAIRNVTSHLNPETPVVVVPQDLKALDLEQFMPNPSAVKRNLAFVDVGSFLDYYNYFKESYKPRLFYTHLTNGLKFLLVFDYDGPGQKVESEAGVGYSAPVPMWGQHTATLELKFHPDYQILSDADEQFFSQELFAYFVEANSYLFHQPDSATMMEIAEELKGTRSAKFQAGKRLANGEVKLEYIETIDVKTSRGELNIPQSLVFASPIFEGQEPQKLNAAFRYRVGNDGTVAFCYKLLTRLDERVAYETARKELEAGTGLKALAVSGFDTLTR